MERCIWWVCLYTLWKCMDHMVMFVLKWHHLHDYFPWLNCPNHHYNNNNVATLPAQWMNNNNRQWATWPAQWTNDNGSQQATSPAQQTNNNNRRQATPPPNRQTTTTDGNQLVNGCATKSRQWQCMLLSLSINLGEHHDSPPHLLHSHENQGAMLPLVTWQLTLGFLLLMTLPTPGLCPMSPLWASACRVAMGSFI